MNDQYLLTDAQKEKKLLAEVSKETLDVLMSKANGFDFFKTQARNLKEAIIACVLASPKHQLGFTDEDLAVAPNYELEIVQLPTNKVLLSVRKK